MALSPMVISASAATTAEWATTVSLTINGNIGKNRLGNGYFADGE